MPFVKNQFPVLCCLQQPGNLFDWQEPASITVILPCLSLEPGRALWPFSKCSASCLLPSQLSRPRSRQQVGLRYSWGKVTQLLGKSLCLSPKSRENALSALSLKDGLSYWVLPTPLHWSGSTQSALVFLQALGVSILAVPCA